MTAPSETWHLFAHGRVQGVGYRAACEACATSLGLTGWVRNRTDGTVEVVATGSPDQLAALRRWMEQGPPAAEVAKVDQESVAPQTFAAFTFGPTA
ncbi:acylphosphatase [Cupriavidus agavae]|uniref:acylphosphatase n=1 Tax=Cupriavidus agavae TaxID=1001822 RepID=A0A4Q7RJH7_9BURK|nr:acylphosphatase [Cupriavidus agavae]RZT32350.1 acylphosphatase [Cupriavidus agavae]